MGPLFVLDGVIEHVRVQHNSVDLVVRTRANDVIHASLPLSVAYARDLWPGATLRFEYNDASAADSTYVPLDLRAGRLILEPNVIVDVTDIAACITSGGIDARHMILRRLPSSEVSPHILYGSIVNGMLDRLLQDPHASDDDVLADAFEQRPLAIAALQATEPTAVISIRERARQTIGNLRAVIPTFPGNSMVIEPSFVAAQYGMQGRLDVMTIHDANPHQRDVIELKTSRPLPSANAVHPQYAAQVAAYDLLLEAVDPQRSGISMVLYANDVVTSMRSVDVTEEQRRTVLHARNQILCLQRQLRERDFRVLKTLRAHEHGWSTYERRDVERFEQVYHNADVVARTYVQAFTSFIENEADALRHGGHEDRTLTDLALQLDASDLEHWHLAFDRQTDHAPTSLRTGDLVVLSPADASTSETTHVYKATILAIDAHHVRVSLRNKQTESTSLASVRQWRIDADVSESLLRAQHRELFTFLEAPASRRAMILGLQRPGTRSIPQPHLPATLHPTQRRVIEQALAANDVAIVQGPPGTGKTSIVVRTLLEQLLADPTERLILMASTNRAVDEIIGVIQDLGITDHVRVGGRHMKYRELAEKLPGTRVVVATVAALQTYPEVFTIVHCTTAIIDEASQLVESQICGMLTRVGRFIMIGDERQLPAVVLQDEERCRVLAPVFAEIGLTDLRMSLFERLLTLYMARGWEEHVGSLSVQARMHQQIQDVANALVYDGALTPAHAWQQTPTDSVRVRYIATPQGTATAVAGAEAQIVVGLINERMAAGIPASSIGVITPFRSQINAIADALPATLRAQITIDTVERYQGSERDVIIISLAVHTVQQLRSAQSVMHCEGRVIDRKFNVAVTRARQELILIGRRDVMEQVEPYAQFLLLTDRHASDVTSPA